MLKAREVLTFGVTPLMVLAFLTGLALAESHEKLPGKAKPEDPVIQNGSTVKLEYTLTDEKGKLLDTNKGKEPLVYTQGEGQIIRGLEKALKGLHAGDEKHVVVPPEEAYGPIKPVIEVSKERIPAQYQRVGAQIMARTQNGPPIPLAVKEIKEKTVVLDGNHPLAGKSLTFDVKVISVEPAPAK